MMTLGDKIKMLRIKHGMTQDELGQKLGVKKAAVHKYESGLVVNIKRDTLEALSVALDTTPAYLLGMTEDADSELTAEQRAVIELYNQATPEARQAALAVLRLANK